MIEILIKNIDLCVAITSICSVFISVLALIATFVIANSQKKFNVNSLRPICLIETRNYEDDIYVKIKNVGQGPMLIQRFCCVDLEQKVTKDDLLELLPNVKQNWSEYGGKIEGSTIEAHGEIFVFRIQPEKKNIKILREKLSHIYIFVEYQDVFKRKYKYEKDLVVYKRRI